MTEAALTIGCALLAFGPLIALFALIVYKKAQLVIVVTTSAFFFLLAALTASAWWWLFDVIGLGGPLAAIIPGVFMQFLWRCGFVALYHRVERVIQMSLEKQHEEELQRQSAAAPHRNSDNGTADTVMGRPPERDQFRDKDNSHQEWTEAAKLRLELNDAACGIAAGVGFGGMHAILLYGTLLASEMSNNIGVLYQESCPSIPSLTVSAIYAFCFFILDIFWMLFTFFGMRRRLIFHRGDHADADEVNAVGGWLGNSRMGGNYALLLTLMTHLVASIITTADYFKHGCYIAIPAIIAMVVFMAFWFWAGIGRIYMPPPQLPGSLVSGSGGSSYHED
jgi:ABC-type multidrug transport system fused ATPase/permease subunit